MADRASEPIWADLLDPGRAAVEAASPTELHATALDRLSTPATPDGLPRPTLETHGEYVFGVLVLPVALPEEDRLVYQEVDLVLTHDSVLTVRKTPPAGTPWDPSDVRAVCSARDVRAPGLVAYHLVDELAERYVDLVDAVNEEIDELDDHVEHWSGERIRRRLSEIRNDLVRIRRTLGPTRDAVRRVLDGRVDLEGAELFPRDVELSFADAYDKLVDAAEGLELSRDLLAAVREYHQAKIATDQADVTKKLAVIASLLLFPTFVVGVYGQNFEHMPELDWYLGYLFSWALIVGSTIAQLALFRWRRWI